MRWKNSLALALALALTPGRGLALVPGCFLGLALGLERWLVQLPGLLPWLSEVQSLVAGVDVGVGEEKV